MGDGTRREFLRGIGVVGVGGAAGCLRLTSEGEGRNTNTATATRSAETGTRAESRPADETEATSATTADRPEQLISESPLLSKAWGDRGEERYDGDLAVEGETIYLFNDGLSVIDAQTGERRWGVDAASLGSNSRPFAIGRRFLARQGETDELHVIDTEQRTLSWRQPVENDYVRPKVVGQTVLYAASGGETLYARDAVTGERLWTYSTAELPSPNLAGNPGFQAWNVDPEGSVYASFSNGYVNRFDARTGEVRWRHGPIDILMSRVGLVVDGDVLYAVGDRTLYKVLIGEESVAWEFGVRSNVRDTPIIDGSTIGLLTDDAVFLIDTNSGRSRARQEIDREGAFALHSTSSYLWYHQGEPPIVYALEKGSGKRHLVGRDLTNEDFIRLATGEDLLMVNHGSSEFPLTVYRVQ